ncbi:MAG: transporter substrate-binding domain-containing protein, partial [Bacteroidales bacterium]|nr:transporter substrate-binding domain-containing protein [Bacteroidales bacterium]
MALFFTTLLFPYFLLSETTDLNLTQAEKAFIAENKAITYVYDPDWAPFEWENGINQHVGMIADILKIIEQRSGLIFQADHSTSWVETVEKLSSGTADMVSTMTITESRKEYLNFTQNTLFTIPYVFVTLAGENYSNGFDALKNKKLAVVKGYAIEGIIEKNYPNQDFHTAHNVQDGFLQLLNREIDVFLVNQATAEYEINKNSYTQLGIAYKTKHPLNLRVAIQKTYTPEALSIIDKTIATITPKEFQILYKKWFSSEKGSIQAHNIIFTKEERQWIHEHQNINFTGDPNWLPIEGFTKEGEYIGIIADL